MSEQLTMEEFVGESASINSFGEQHLACVLLLDTSGSMSGTPIKNLSSAIARFKENVNRDPIARNRVDVAIVSFSTGVEVISDFKSITDMPTPELDARGRTDMAAGIQTAIDMVKRRTAFYQSFGTPCHKPWIFMITDGVSTSNYQDMLDAANRIKEEENKGSHGRLSFWALGIGSYDSEELFGLTKRVLELKSTDFDGIFDWLSESMSCISQSQVGDQVSFGNLPDDARKAKEDRAIDEGWY